MLFFKQFVLVEICWHFRVKSLREICWGWGGNKFYRIIISWTLVVYAGLKLRSHLLRNPELANVIPLIAWSRSEYSHACHCLYIYIYIYHPLPAFKKKKNPFLSPTASIKKKKSLSFLSDVLSSTTTVYSLPYLSSPYCITALVLANGVFCVSLRK